MTPVELVRIAHQALDQAEFVAQTRGVSGEHGLEIMAHAQLSIAASLALLARLPGRDLFDVDPGDPPESESERYDRERVEAADRDRKLARD